MNNEEIKALESAAKIKQMMDTPGFTEVFEPFLKQKMSESFPDPAQFTNATDPKEAFFYAALTASVFKKVVAELLGYFSQKEYNFIELTKKKNGEATIPQVGE